MEFAWLAGEQAFYARRGLADPKRCRYCRVSDDEVPMQLYA
ncbi:MAG: zinc-ribbon domain containing protein [Terracidiphilus sp.]